jgi:coenzyme PQQ synthesis protein D (PqqD)
VGFRRRADLSVREIDGEVVIVDREMQRIHQLNSTASFVWNRVDPECDVVWLAQELSRRFDVEESAALADVKRVIEELRALRLLESDSVTQE